MDNSRQLQQEIDLLQAEANSFAVRFIPDAKARQQYARDTQAYAQELLEQVHRGKKPARVAAQEAARTRNVLMKLTRDRISEIGKAFSESLKKEGLSISELEAKYAQKLFGCRFEALARPHKVAVWTKIIERSGVQRPWVNMFAKGLGYGGRALIAVSLGLIVYEVCRADDKVRAAANETANAAGGLAGAYIGGKAGAVCGPWCIAVGVVVGGALGAFGVDAAFDSLWK